MHYQNATFIIVISLGFLLGIAGDASAQKLHQEGITPQPIEQPRELQPVEQPLVSKVIVTGTGLSLIVLELWWFVLSKPKSHTAAVNDR
ncbi:MAG: hypothetical protein AAGA75_16095 [Cyanobacteria bacterium P01_E01_bin.6]